MTGVFNELLEQKSSDTGDVCHGTLGQKQHRQRLMSYTFVFEVFTLHTNDPLRCFSSVNRLN